MENTFEKAVEYVQETYCDSYISTPYLLLGDVAKLIKITTGKDVDWQTLAKYTNKTDLDIKYSKSVL